MSRDATLRRTLWAGAAYDVALGLFILFGSPAAFRALGYTGAPDSPFYSLSTLPLFVLPLVYVAAARARDTREFRLPVLGARLLGGLLVIGWVLWQRPEAPAVYVTIGVVDWVWAGLHYAYGYSTRV